METGQEILPLSRILALLRLRLQSRRRVVRVLREDGQNGVQLRVIVLVIIGHGGVYGLIVLTEIPVRFHLEAVYLRVVLGVLLRLDEDVQCLAVPPPLKHRARLTDHRRGVGLVLFQHGVEDGNCLVEAVQEYQGASVVEGDSLKVLLVVFLGECIRSAKGFGGLLCLIHVLIDMPFPPVKSGHGNLAFLRLVHLQGVVYVGEGGAILTFRPVEPGTQQQRLNVVRSLLELAVDQVERLGIVLLFPQRLPGALEVVVVADIDLGLLGVGLAADKGQHQGNEDGDVILHKRTCDSCFVVIGFVVQRYGRSANPIFVVIGLSGGWTRT